MRKLRDVPLFVVAGSTVFASVLLSYLLVDCDAPGFVVGAVVDTTAAVAFFGYSYITDQDFRSHLHDHRLVRGGIERSRRARKVRAIKALHVSVSALMRYCALLDRMGTKSGVVRKADWPQFKDDLLIIHNAVERSARASETALGNADHFVGGASDDILEAIGWLEGPVRIDDDKGTADTARYGPALDLLGPALARLGRHLDLAKSRPPSVAGEQDRLALSLGRDTYPPGMAVRATVEVYGRHSPGRVTVTVHGRRFGRKPKATGMLPAPGLRQPSAITLSIDMGRRKLDAGQEYTARAECGDLSDEAVFVVDHVAPAVHADRLACTVGDCICITVDDPAACAGGTRAGLVCGEKGPRLTVGPSNKQIGCRLEEAGHSPGKFYGRVICVSAHASGFTQYAASGAGLVGTDGEGAKIAAIPCGPNQLIHINYERGNEVAWTAVLVEEPDAGAAGPASAGDGGGGGSGQYTTEPASRCREVDRADRTQSALEGERGRGR